MGISLGAKPFAELISALKHYFNEGASLDPAKLKSLLNESYDWPDDMGELNQLFILMIQHQQENELLSFLGGPDLNALISCLWLSPDQDILQQLLMLPWEKQASESEASINLPIKNPVILLASLTNNFPRSYLNTYDIEGLEEILTFLISIEKKSTPSLNAAVKNIGAFNDYIQSLNQPGRYQVIIENEAHYTACEIYIKSSESGLEKKALVLDAALDPRVFATTSTLTSNNITVFVGGPTRDEEIMDIQKDTFSCPLFAFDHIVQLSKLSDIDTFIVQYSELTVHFPKSNLRLLDWINLPYQLVWNAQSMDFIKKYEVKQSQEQGLLSSAEDKKIFNEYIAQGTIIENGKPRNHSIALHVRNTIIEKAIWVILPFAFRTTEQMKMKETIQKQVTPEPNTALGLKK